MTFPLMMLHDWHGGYAIAGFFRVNRNEFRN